MPNDKSDLCCLSCQWSVYPDRRNPNLVQCEKHQAELHFPGAMFCSDLSHNQFPELAVFIQTHDFDPETMYEWISGAEDGGWYQYFPSFEHAAYLLATLQEYRSLSRELAFERIHANRAQRLAGGGGQNIT